MHSERVTSTLCGVWILAICIGGLATTTVAVQLWIVLASVAIVPLILGERLWDAPVHAISARIKEARR
jgi:hypothetical protein